MYCLNFLRQGLFMYPKVVIFKLMSLLQDSRLGLWTHTMVPSFHS